MLPQQRVKTIESPGTVRTQRARMTVGIESGNRTGRAPLRRGNDATKARGIVYVITSSALFGLVPVLVREAYSTGMDVFGIVLLRMAIAAFVMVTVCLAKQLRLRMARKPLLSCIAASGFYAASTLLSCAAMKDMSAGLSNMLFHLYPVFVLFFARFTLKQAVGWSKWACAGAMMAGMLLIFATESGWEFTNASVLLVVVAAVCSAAYTLILGGKTMRAVPSPVFTAYACIASVVACCISIPFLPPEVLTFTLDGTALVVLIALACTALPLALYASATKAIGSSSVSLFANFEPGMTVVAESIETHQLPGASGLLGCAIIIASGMILGKNADMQTGMEDESGKKEGSGA